MGGFTAIYLRDCSEQNIAEQNKKLHEYGVAKKYRFYSINDIKDEYAWFIKGKGNFPEHQFPKKQIKSFTDFRKFWSPAALGEVFCPHIGSLTFDCYFGRTSKKSMRAIGKYLFANSSQIKKVSGSFETFMERGMTLQESESFKELLNAEIKC